MKTALLLSLLLLVPQDSNMMTLTTVQGDTVTAQVLELNGDKAKLKVSILGAQATVTRKVSDFDSPSIFRIEMAAKPPKDFDSHFAMAKRAGDLRLLSQAGGQARKAVEAVKEPAEQEAKRKEVRTWAANTLETMLEEAVAQHRLSEARHCLKILSTRLPEQRTEAQLDVLAGKVAAVEERNANDREAARVAKLDAQAREKTKKALDGIRQHLAQGDKLSREAISKSNSTVASSNLCEKAIDAYKAGWKKLQDLLEKGTDDEALAGEATALSQQLHDHGINAALHAANMLTTQSNYKGAMEWTNRILAFDPDNAEAKDMQRTIQVAAAAASNEWQWGWGVRGTPPPVVDPRKN